MIHMLAISLGVAVGFTITAPDWVTRAIFGFAAIVNAACLEYELRKERQ